MWEKAGNSLIVEDRQPYLEKVKALIEGLGIQKPAGLQTR